MTTTAEQVQQEMLEAIKDLQLELKGLKNKIEQITLTLICRNRQSTQPAQTRPSIATAMGLVRTKVNSTKESALATRTTQPLTTRWAAARLIANNVLDNLGAIERGILVTITKLIVS